MTTCPRRIAIRIFLMTFAMLAIPWTALAVNHGAIRPGETLTGTLTAAAQTDTFTFDGAASQTVIITMSKAYDNSIDPQIDLYDPDGIWEAGYYSYGPAAHIPNYKLKKSGTYTILCSDFEKSHIGNYALTLTKIPVPAFGAWNPDCGPILSGQTLYGVISLPSSADTFTFYGDTSQTVIFTMSQAYANSIDPQIDLYDPDGIWEAGYYSSGPAAHFPNYKLKKSGTYTILCSDFEKSHTGNYALTLTKIPGAALGWKDMDGGEILSGQTRTARLDAGGDADVFRFTARSSDTIILTMSQAYANSIDPQIDLYDPDGIWETGVYVIGPAAHIPDYKLKKTGTYTILCSDFEKSHTGDYSIAFSQIPPADLGLVRPFPLDGGYAWVDVTLRWDASPSATGYDVYLGTTEPLALVAQNTTETAFRPASDLTLGASYLWYVVAHRPQGDMPGPMYLFRTTIPGVRLRDYLLGKIALTPEELFAADVNADMKVDIADLIAMYLRGY